MVMMAQPLFDAVESVKTESARVVLLSPQGRRFDQEIAGEYSESQHNIFVCGHYEGVDERVREALVTDEISIGDYVLTNGTLAAAVRGYPVPRRCGDRLCPEDAFQDRRRVR